MRDADGRLLVVRRGHAPAAGRWTLPGGRVDPGESLVEAVRREVAEETGLEVEVGDLVGHSEARDDDHHFVILDFAAEVVGGQARAASDVEALRWVGREELLGLDTTDGLLDFLDRHGVELP